MQQLKTSQTQKNIPPPTGRITGAVCCDVGLVRERNEDSYLLGGVVHAASAAHSACQISSEGNLIAGVFDGMGGGEAGELAADYAAQTFREIRESLSVQALPAEIDQILRAAFQQANNAVVSLRETTPVLGTTGTVLCAHNGYFKIYHVGDSRAYRFRNGRLEQLTRDQTLAQMKLELGLYGQSHEQFHLEKHLLTEYIGRDWTKESFYPTESAWIPLLPGDVLLLCSDGLYECCSDKKIAEILARKAGPVRAAEALVQAANEQGGADNCTALLLYAVP